MKNKLQLLLTRVFLFALVMVPAITSAQINYTQDFNSGLGGWSDDYFEETEVATCNGAGAVRYNLWFLSDYAEMVSPSLGTSNGGEVTISYKYKIVNYDFEEPTEPTENIENWGVMEIYYATSPTGPWNFLQTINPANHVESASCATKTTSFFPPAGSNVYIAMAVALNGEDSDFYFYFDEFTAMQSTPIVCSGAPAAANTLSASTFVCNTQQITLSLSTAYTNTGITYQWQSSADGTTFTDVAGTSPTFTTVPATTKWYRAKISCGTDFIYSTPLQITSNGMACLCDIEFDPDADIEPITEVVFAGINNPSSATVNGTPGVQDFKALPPAQVVQGQSYPISLKGNTAGPYTNYFTVFIDWNHNGVLTDQGEMYQINSINSSTGLDNIVATGSITVPANALPGMTYMRVFKLYDAYPDDPCSSEIGFGFGQAEDYMVNVSLAPTFDWVNVQHPATMTLTVGQTGVVYAQGYEPGLTEAAGAGAGVSAWIGISNQNTDPATWTTWIPATFNVQAGNNDEFMATIGAGLEPGTYYYASRFQINTNNYVYGGINGIWNAASSISGILTVTCGTPAPDADATQTLCAGSTLADLEAEGNAILWYSDAQGGTALSPTTALIDGGIYFAAQTPAGGCESVERTEVTVTVTTTPAPQALLIEQSFCQGATISEIEVGAEGDVVWYASATSTTPLSDDFVISGLTPYYASQIIDGCESQVRTPVTVIVTTALPPTGDATQQFAAQASLSDIELVATGTVNYYSTEEDALSGENALSPEDVIPAGSTTYYITQTIDGCESAPYTVTVDMTLGNQSFLAGSFTYYPNPVNDVLTLSYTEGISSVEVYNLIGQKVMSKEYGQNNVQLSMATLSGGTYLVKVISGEDARVIKVVKK